MQHIAIFVAVSGCLSQTHALTIKTLYVPEGNIINGISVAEAQPSNTIGGGQLTNIVRAAADRWESLIPDDHVLTLNFGWAPTPPYSDTAFHQGLSAVGIPNRETLGSLAFNSNYNNSPALFLDPTPGTHEEYKFSSQEFADFGGGSLEVRRDSQFISAEMNSTQDLYSIALHEIGHALGFVGWESFELETEDGDIDVQMAPWIGSELPASNAHLQIAGTIMSYAGPPNVRRDVTQADLLAVCQLSGFSGCDFRLRPTIELADSDGDNDVDGQDFLAWQQGTLPTHGVRPN